MTTRIIEVNDLGWGIFQDKKTGTNYIWDLQDGVMGVLENQDTLEISKVLEDLRDNDDNVTHFIVTSK